MSDSSHTRLDRRRFVTYLSALGLGGTVFPAALWAQVHQASEVTKEMIRHAEGVSGLEFDDDERELMRGGLNRQLQAYQELRQADVPNSVVPAIRFDPLLPGRTSAGDQHPMHLLRPTVRRPASDAELAFLPVTHLAELIRTRQVSSSELTELYLDRLNRHSGALECVITVTDALARELAQRADDELARGVYRGPLHGIPWGAKDLLAARGYRTTWGAKPFENQTIDEDATVVRRLTDAGAVLVAKLTLGALAWGDVWYGGRTRNPWNLEQGSSGSSAGSASATAAGLVGFAIGSETLGSIVSPATRCGVTGLRPTFGRVSRAGAMALSWTMDKLGPLCRSVEDCALVFDAIHGPDGIDGTVHDAPFNWSSESDLSKLRVGYLQSAFERDYPERDFDAATLDVLRDLGARLIPVEMPDQFPVGALSIILNAEAAAAFDELTRNNRDAEMVRQIENAWPNVFRQARMIPAVEYLQANRVRTMVMGAMQAMMGGIDVFVTPTSGPRVLLTTNLTGHPTVVLPNGFRENGTPVSISFVGKLFGDAETLAVAKAYQDATTFHQRHPEQFMA